MWHATILNVQLYITVLLWLGHTFSHSKIARIKTVINNGNDILSLNLFLSQVFCAIFEVSLLNISQSNAHGEQFNHFVWCCFLKTQVGEIQHYNQRTELCIGYF